MQSRWRLRARQVVALVLRETQGQDEAAIRKALREAYPFGERKYWPYKVWLDEIRRQRSSGGRGRGTPTPGVVPRQHQLF